MTNLENNAPQSESQNPQSATGDQANASGGSGKKTLLVIVAVAGLLALTLLADRGWKGGGPVEPGTTTITDLHGKELDLAPYKGKVVLVNFWATWCEPCLTEMPWMMGFQEKYAARGFTVLGVAMDDEGMTTVEPWVKEKVFDVDGRQMRLNYPILIGGEVVGQQFGGIIGLPTTLVIARDGTVVKRFIGLASHDTLVAEIEKQL